MNVMLPMKTKLKTALCVLSLLSACTYANAQTQEKTTQTPPQSTWLTEADLPAKTVTQEDLREAQKQGYTKDSAYTVCMYLVENFASISMYMRQNGVTYDKAMSLGSYGKAQDMVEGYTEAAYDVPVASTHEGKKEALDKFMVSSLQHCVQSSPK